jgi:protein-histidine N-methyltransferase
LVLFHYAVSRNMPVHFTFTDYNLPVLQNAVLPNLLLAFARAVGSELFNNPLADISPGSCGDLEITPTFTAMLLDRLRKIDLHLTFISGSWMPSDAFLELIPSKPKLNTLVLASETIYSPKALADFAAVLAGILRVVLVGKAIIAAKRIYFGVGGSVDAFKVECARHGAIATEIDGHGIDVGDDAGVRRCILEVQMA